MPRLSSLVVLLGLLGVPLVTAAFNQTEQNINADCDNSCFFHSFNGSCANDPACMCDQKKYREAYFCCMGKNCASSVLPDSIVRQNRECEARNMPFTFDAEAACGITLTTTTAVATTSDSAVSTKSTTSTTTATSSDSSSSAASTVSSGASSPSGTSGSSSTGSKSSTAASTSTPTGNGATANTVALNAVVGIIAASVMLL